MKSLSVPVFVLLVLVLVGFSSEVLAQDNGDYADLLSLFEEFRDFAQEGYRGDISGYAAAM